MNLRFAHTEKNQFGKLLWKAFSLDVSNDNSKIYIYLYYEMNLVWIFGFRKCSIFNNNNKKNKGNTIYDA